MCVLIDAKGVDGHLRSGQPMLWALATLGSSRMPGHGHPKKWICTALEQPIR
jgi:hypothetical protein